jgi:spermidine synthase
MGNRILFLVFFLSGFCGLLYQVVWLRLAFSAFGIVTPVLSLVISVFMLGLALGSWFAGKLANPLRMKGLSPLYAYAMAEFVIAIGAFVVPQLFDLSQTFLGEYGEVNSQNYLWLSAVLITLSLLPCCFAMGTTYPLMMAYMKDENLKDESRFSFLYLANVIGAMVGAVTTALVLIEIFGFRRSLLVAAAFNSIIAITAFILASKAKGSFNPKEGARSGTRSSSTRGDEEQQLISKRFAYGILFLTGFTSIAMEVIWTRAFTPVLKTTIYAFAMLLATYLLATCLGSYLYRKHLAEKRSWTLQQLMPFIALTSLLPLVINDPYLYPRGSIVLLSIFPFCCLLGYLTPKLIDGHSSGDPDRAGRVYAINMIGCILGPLFAGYILLPYLGVKWSLLVTALPYLGLMGWSFKGKILGPARGMALIVAAVGILVTHTYEDKVLYKKAQVMRDHTATVISEGEGMNRRLLVNGIGITFLTPITKIMAHLPLASLPKAPESSLVICFGMGTSFRSLMSWGIDVTAVELVPSVKEAFPYFFSDAAKVTRDPKSRIIIDDGRRFLRRSTAQFDVVTVDPPPPVEAAGSSLLYSREFYQDVKKHLKPGGILQQWFPGGEEKILHAIARSLTSEFPHVRVYRSIENWGYHFLASERAIESLTPEQMLERLPENAKADLMEWYPNRNIKAVVVEILNKEIPLSTVVNADPKIFVSDDQPYNEYFVLRRLQLN